MTVFSAKKVEKALEKVGHVNENGDHNRYRLYIDGKRTDIRTKTSHNGQDIGDDLIASMARQIHLSRKEFISLVNGQISKNEYLEILKANKII